MTISAQHPWCLRIMIFGSKWHQHLQLQLFPEIRPGWVGGGLVGELGKNAPKAPRFPHDFWEKKIVGNFFFTPSWPSKLSKVVYGHFGQPKTSFSQLWCLLCKLGGGLKQVLFLLLPGEMIQLILINFSNGLKPPTSKSLKCPFNFCLSLTLRVSLLVICFISTPSAKSKIFPWFC